MSASVTTAVEQRSDQNRKPGVIMPNPETVRPEEPLKIDAIVPDEVGPGETFRLYGSGFGPCERHGREVMIGARRCEIVAWRSDRIALRAPHKLLPGCYRPRLRSGGRENEGHARIEMNLLTRQQRRELKQGARLLLIADVQRETPGDQDRLELLEQIQAHLDQYSISDKLILALWPESLGSDGGTRAREIGARQGADLMLHGSIDARGAFHPLLTMVGEREEALALLPELLVGSLAASPLFGQETYRLSPTQTKRSKRLAQFIAGWFLNRMGRPDEARALFLSALDQRDLGVEDAAAFRFMAGVAGYGMIPLPAQRSDSGIATEVLNHFEQAARIYDTEGFSSDRARACLNLAGAYAALNDSRTFLVREMEWARTALSLLKPSDQPRETLAGHIYLVSALIRLAENHEGAERENFLDDGRRAVATARASASRQPASLAQQILDFAEAVILGRRYRGGRDENLSNALLLLDSVFVYFTVDTGVNQRIIPIIRAQQAECLLNLAAGNRESHLQRAHAFFEESQNHPLASTLSRVRSFRLKTRVEDLVQDLGRPGADTRWLSAVEMTRRFEQRIADLRKDDLARAVDEAVKWLQWANGKGSANFQTASAHRTLGVLRVDQKQYEQARRHFYNAMVIAAGILHPGGPRYRFVYTLRFNFEMVSAILNERGDALLQNAMRGALLFARKHYHQGVKREVLDPVHAIEDFTEALSWFPDYHEAMVRRAVASYRSGDNSGALLDLESALRLSPTDETGLFLRQKIMAERQKSKDDRAPDQAIRFGRRHSGQSLPA